MTDKHYAPDKRPKNPELDVHVLEAVPSPWLVANTIANVVTAAVAIGVLIALWVSTWG